MARLLPLLAVLLLTSASCKSGAGDSENEESTESTESGNEGTAENNPAGETTTAQAGNSGDAVAGGTLTSARFNIRMQVPGSWNLLSTEQDDSVMVEGGDGLMLIIASSQSTQLVEANFAAVNDRVSFDSVNLEPDRSETRPINGIPGYRVFGDARLRGEDVPLYFISQALQMSNPVVVTVYIDAESYFEHSDAMIGMLDSIEAIDLRQE
jgi:hypothetical protein